MAEPAPIAEAGLSFERSANGECLAVVDTSPEACEVRNRAAEVVARVLSDDRRIRVLDASRSGLQDVGVGHLCLALRRTDQLEELTFCPVGHAGLEFVLGVVRRCTRLKTLRLEVRDEPTLYVGRTRLEASDYDTSGYSPPAEEGEEDEAPAEEELEEGEESAEEKKAKLLQQIFRESDYDSGDEGHVAPPASASETLSCLLGELVSEVRKMQNLTCVECFGDAVPASIQADLRRAVEEHVEALEKREKAKEDKGARTAYDALGGQMQELLQALEGHEKEDFDVAAALANGADPTRLGIRSFVSRRLFAALGEALFECQRFKSKENEAVLTAEGEMAFIAMHLRKHANSLQGS